MQPYQNEEHKELAMKAKRAIWAPADDTSLGLDYMGLLSLFRHPNTQQADESGLQLDLETTETEYLLTLLNWGSSTGQGPSAKNAKTAKLIPEELSRHAYAVLFGCLDRLGNLREAVRQFEKAAALTLDDHPDKPACLSGLGNAYLQLFQRLEPWTSLKQFVAWPRLFIRKTPRSPGGLPKLVEAVELIEMNPPAGGPNECLTVLDVLDRLRMANLEAVRPKRPVLVEHSRALVGPTRRGIHFDELDGLNGFGEASWTARRFPDVARRSSSEARIPEQSQQCTSANVRSLRRVRGHAACTHLQREGRTTCLSRQPRESTYLCNLGGTYRALSKRFGALECLKLGNDPSDSYAQRSARVPIGSSDGDWRLGVAR
ncbi:hypothetical protein FRC10_008960 [Ceratobasidium sp. 414]|nr:hypothetical protein FRC10_008960 [Ceratobasidium sp. 414]